MVRVLPDMDKKQVGIHKEKNREASRQQKNKEK